MHPTPLLLVFAVLGLLGLALVVLTVRSIGLCFRRSWSDARRTAATSFWLSVLVLFLAWFAIPMCVMMLAVKAVPSPDIDGASGKARVLGETISEGMNSTVHVALNAPIAAVIWGIAAWRTKRARRDGEAAGPS